MSPAYGRYLGLVLAVVGTALAVNAAPAPPQPSPPPSQAETKNRYVIPFEKYSLANGLEVILHRDPSLPLVALNLWYHVGPANEPEGRSGFAHLFEHLMFEGSKYAGRQFDVLLESVGATDVNGTTSWDRTNYYETVPRQHLELVLWLESDRMGFMLDALNRERLDVQREVVKNERRQRYENTPYGATQLAVYDVLFPKGHPYHGAIIGSMEDLTRASLDDVASFFRSYYSPSNATLTLAGDFDPDSARALIQRYFGPLPSAPKPPSRRSVTPPLAKETRRVVDEPVELAKLTMAWITPPVFTPDDVALDIVSAILAGGKATRLYQDLVVRRRISPEVDVWLDSNQLASTFQVEALASRGAEPAALEQAIDGVLAELASRGPSPDELARAKTGIRFGALSTLQRLNDGGGDRGRAGLLQTFNHYLGDPGRLPQYMRDVESVRAEDVQRAVDKHLGRNARVVVTTRPTKNAAQNAGAPPPKGP